MDEEPRIAPNSAGGPADGAGSLAREMARAYLQMREFYRREMAPAAADAWAGDPAGDDVGRIAETPPHEISWWTLGRLAALDPERAQAAWERILAEARDELASGHRAAQALEWDGTPWRRARFLAIREAFVEEWRPRGGVELALIDQMAQAHTSYLFWMERLHIRSVGEARVEDRTLERDGSWEPPRVDAAAALEQAAAMADRFSRLFLRDLRALRDLRRYAPAVVVQGSAQINVAQRQVNVNRASRPVGGDVAGTSRVRDLDGMS
jgi:hypothetical protein